MQDAQSVFFESLIVVACVCSIVRLRSSRSASTCFYCLGLCFPAFSSSVAVVYFGWCVRRCVLASNHAMPAGTWTRRATASGTLASAPRRRPRGARACGARRRRPRDAFVTFPAQIPAFAPALVLHHGVPGARAASAGLGGLRKDPRGSPRGFSVKVRPPQVARSWRRPWSRPTAPSRT